MKEPNDEQLEVGDVQKQPVTVGLLCSIIGGALLVVGYTVGVVLWISGIAGTAKDGITDNSRKIETVTTKLEASQTQRELTMRNRDLQIDNIKSDVDRVSKRQDATDATLGEVVKKMERVLVLTESIKEQLDEKQRKQP